MCANHTKNIQWFYNHEYVKKEKFKQEYNKNILRDVYKSYNYDYVIRKEDGSNRIIKNNRKSRIATLQNT